MNHGTIALLQATNLKRESISKDAHCNELKTIEVIYSALTVCKSSPVGAYFIVCTLDYSNKSNRFLLYGRVILIPYVTDRCKTKNIVK